ncbi:MAG: hypothetical protein AB9842_07205 [Bacteroidales bacterium]
MSPLVRILIFSLLTLLYHTVPAQDENQSVSSLIGIDPVLHNGKQYTYYPPLGTGGHQYYSSSHYPTGKLWIRGNVYENQRLNYDVYNQHLILFYKDADGSGKTIIVSDAWLEAFTLGSSKFIFIPDNDSIKHIYQEIGNGSMKVLFRWRKEWILEPSVGAHMYIFTSPAREMFLFENSSLRAFNNNRSFVNLFKTEEQALVKKYLRQHHIKIKKADTDKIVRLVDYINSISTR